MGGVGETLSKGHELDQRSILQHRDGYGLNLCVDGLAQLVEPMGDDRTSSRHVILKGRVEP